MTHFHRFPGERGDHVWQRFERREVGGVDVVTMNDADLLLYLAVHGTKDQWRRLAWLADFAWLAVNRPDATELARMSAAEHGLRVVWETSCDLADAWYGTSLAVRPRSRLIAERVAYLVQHVCLMRADPLTIPGGARRYTWNAYDSRAASAAQLAMHYIAPTYAGIRNESDFEPLVQKRRQRAARGLRRLLRSR